MKTNKLKNEESAWQVRSRFVDWQITFLVLTMVCLPLSVKASFTKVINVNQVVQYTGGVMQKYDACIFPVELYDVHITNVTVDASASTDMYLSTLCYKYYVNYIGRGSSSQ